MLQSSPIRHHTEDPGQYPINPVFAAMAPFPTHLLPSAIRDYVETSAKSLDCDPTYIALPVLSALASAIGTSRLIRLKKKWNEPAILWTAIIAEAPNKEALELATEPLQIQQQKALPKLRQAMLEFDRLQNLYKRKRGSVYDGKYPHRPDAPMLHRSLMQDWRLSEVLKSVPKNGQHGLLIATDELDAWLGKSSRYGERRATQLATWHSLHAGKPELPPLRRNEVPNFIQSTSSAISVTGTVQTEVLINKFIKDKVPCSLASRLLFAMPNPLPRRWTDYDLEDDQIDRYHAVINKLSALKPDLIDIEDAPEEERLVKPPVVEDLAPPLPEVKDPDFGEKLKKYRDFQDEQYKKGPPQPPPALKPQRAIPLLVNLDPDARSEFADFMDHLALQQDDQDIALQPWLQNLPGHTARLALVLHLARWAAGEKVDPTTCDAESMVRAIDLAAWFANEAVRVMAHLSISAHQKDQWDLMDWILKRGGVVSTRDVNRHSRKYPTANDAENAINELVQTGIGRWVLYPAGPQGGRPFAVYSLSSDLDGGLPPVPFPGYASNTQTPPGSVNAPYARGSDGNARHGGDDVRRGSPDPAETPDRRSPLQFEEGSVSARYASGATVLESSTNPCSSVGWVESSRPTTAQFNDNAGSVNTPNQPARDSVRFDEQPGSVSAQGAQQVPSSLAPNPQPLVPFF